MTGFEDYDGPDVGPSLYLSYRHFERPPLEKEDKSEWNRIADTALQIASLGIVSFAEVKLLEREEEIHKQSALVHTLTKSLNETRYFKTYPLFEYSKEISKKEFDREMRNNPRFHNRDFVEQIDPIEKEVPYAGATLSLTLRVEAKISTTWNVRALGTALACTFAPVILNATVYK